jgi:hypothetical protein
MHCRHGWKTLLLGVDRACLNARQPIFQEKMFGKFTVFTFYLQ